MKSTRRSQITIFIIMGIIILLSVISVIYIFSRQSKVTEQGIFQTEETPSEIMPIVEYTKKCIQDISIAAFKKIGQHGGYIDLNDPSLSGRYFSLNDNPTESDALSLGTKNNVVYWWYMNTPNNCIDCTLNSQVPTLSEIENQMNLYIERELKKCTVGFVNFKNSGFDVKEGSVAADTKIAIDDVNIEVTYPLEIKKAGSTFTTSDFRVNLDLNFRAIYELALRITIHEINNQFLEDIITHLISLYSYKLSPDLIPPLAFIDNRETTINWKFDEVEKRLREDLLTQLSILQINNTQDAIRVRSNNPQQQGIYDVMFLDILNKTILPYKVNFLYQSGWPIYFNINPRSGNILKPAIHKQDYILNIVPSTQINSYEFFYDISSPLLVTIRDDESLKNTGEPGYIFMFSLEPNIRKNKNLQQWSQGQGTFNPIDYSQVSFSNLQSNQHQSNCTPSNPQWTCFTNGNKFTNQATCTANCNNYPCNMSYSNWICPLDNQNYDLEQECNAQCISQTQNRVQQSSAKSLFCDPSQKISGDIKINIKSKTTSQKISDVVIDYKCGNGESCPMGVTNSSGDYISKFPVCIGDGSLKLEKEGYMTKIIPHISIEVSESKTINIEMEPLIKKQVDVVYINVTNMFRINRYMDSNSDNIKNQLNRVKTPFESLRWIRPSHWTGNPPSDKLTPAEVNLLLNEAIQAENKLNSAKDLTKNKNYWYEIKREEVVRVVKTTKEAINQINIFIDSFNSDPNYIKNKIGREFTGSVVIPPDVKPTLQTHLIKINEILKNIQFFDDSDLYSFSVISSYRNNALPLKDSERVIISLERIKDTPYDQNIPLPQLVIQGSNTTSTELVPGNYQVNIQFQDLNGLSIPKPTGGDIDYTPAQLGGAYLNNESGYWSIDQNDLSQGNNIRLYFLRVDNPENTEDLNEVGQISAYSKRYRAYIEPKFLP